MDRIRLATQSVAVFSAALLFSAAANSQDIRLDVGETERDPTWLVMPFLFNTEALDTAYGIAGGTTGYFQPQMSTFAAVMGSTNDTVALFLSVNDYQFQSLPRMFATMTGSLGDWTKHRTYAGFDPAFPGERAGSNNSSEDNFFGGNGQNNWFDLNFRYLFPTGDGRENLIDSIYLDRGIVDSGDVEVTAWSPAKSGRLYLDSTFFYNTRSFEQDTNNLAGDTNGLELALEYDNRDFSANPSKGSLQRIAIKRDFGWFGSNNSWTNLGLDLRKYISLGSAKGFRQRVLALNIWTSYSPTWNITSSPNGPVVENRPPNVEGASLGGFDRLRAYPTDRFSDKAAVLYVAELRLISSWNPRNWRLLDFLEVDWIQLVPFVEVGRVAPGWSLSDLHNDMKWDVGLGLRFMMRKAVFRIEVAGNDDSSSGWVMIGQPF